MIQQNLANCVVVGLSGYAQSGKDHTFLQIEELYDSHSQRVAFADPIKTHVNNMFGWGYDQQYGDLKEVVDPYWGFSPRMAYQLFGTEFGRTLSEDIWVLMAIKEMEKIAQENPNAIIVITDVRFWNEVQAIQGLNNSILVSIYDPSKEPKYDESGDLVFPTGVNVHVSEQFIPEIRDQADIVICNDHGKEYAKGLKTLIETLENIDRDQVYKQQASR